MQVQLTKAGNFLPRTRSVLPTGEKHRMTFGNDNTLKGVSTTLVDVTWLALDREHSITSKSTYLVSNLTGLGSTKQQNMLPFVCFKATESKPVKLEISCQ